MDAGYYRVDTFRLPDGTVRSEAQVFDTPQLAPAVPHPAAGERATGRAVTPPVKNPGEVPTLPAQLTQADEQTRMAVAALFRAIRPEPRLRLGMAEAQQLAPLVVQWLERGSTAAELAQALLPGLPSPVVHSPVAILRDRLQRKLPPMRSGPPPTAYSECAKCHDPVPRPGICRPCAGLGTRTVAVGTGAAATRGGVARARAALRGRHEPLTMAGIG
ncbi:hypothetical protein [Kitasatospora sp. SUK 42]|uniref:hypothetical protein n=1 Tax=Kitasatospora sp. SUK 42 TaxID=1588882 RepID=UPI0018C9B1B6|nr:hypothetical protein [Kitasatospora sp. SUK 42]MBV2154209.1 hypothetical protein [Kitasatospora sp. SUK 42]